MTHDTKTKSLRAINNAKISTRLVAITAILAAMITIMTAYIFHIPVGTNGGYVHFGDSLIYIAACLLPWPYAMLAGAIGGGMADLLTAPVWAPATIIIKALITIPFSNKSSKITTPRNIIATVIAFMISGTCYYIAEAIMFGTKTAFISALSGSLVQSGGSAVFFILFAITLDKIGFKKRYIGE